MKNTLLTVLIATLLFCSCQSTDKNSVLEKNKEVVLEYHKKVWSEGKMESLNDIITSDFTCHYLTSEKWKGIDEAKKNISNWRALFPDWKEEIVDVIQENDKVVMRYKATATHTKTYEGIDSTGAKIEIYEVSIYRISNGKIAEQWAFPDDPAIKTQILNFKKQQE